MILHLLNKASSHPSYQLCAAAVSPGDSILLIENGVYCATSNCFKSLPEQTAIYVLQSDCEARGVCEHLQAGYQLIDEAEFVKLCCDNDKVISWY